MKIKIFINFLVVVGLTLSLQCFAQVNPGSDPNGGSAVPPIDPGANPPGNITKPPATPPAPNTKPAVMIQHPPYEMQMCDSCHEMDKKDKTPITDKFTMKQPDLCYQCHDKKDTGKVVHPALTMGDCTTCHNPHESAIKPLLNDKIINLCTSCHDAPGRDQSTKHSALVMVKSCVRCHSPHSSDREKLLKDEPNNLCLYCHKDIKDSMAKPGVTVHPAIEMGCTGCHKPHGSAEEKLLMEQPNKLCFECHDEKSFLEGHPRRGHPTSGPKDPLYPEKAFTCVSCHKPHVSQNAKLLRYNFKRGETPYDGTICSVCHWENFMPPPGPPRPPWNKK